jgi:hypothetical protein
LVTDTDEFTIANSHMFVAGLDQHVSRDSDRFEFVKEGYPPHGRGLATCE